MLLTKDHITRLNDLSDQLEEIYEAIPTYQYTTPLNMSDEREKIAQAYMNGDEYNPQFRYADVPEGIEIPLIEFVKALDPEASYWEYLLHEDVTQSIASLIAIYRRDASLLTANSINSHGLPSKELVEDANVTLEQPTREQLPQDVDSTEAGEFIASALSKAGLTEWRVVFLEDMHARMMVRSSEKIVFIKNGASFSRGVLFRLVIHEIGTHVFRYENGVCHPLRLLRLGLKGYMVTEEGMATYNEARFSTQDLDTLRRYAARVIAAHLSLTHSFFEVFAHLVRKGLSTKEAYAVVTRAKRAFINTAEHGANVKDKAYLEGYRTVSRHLQNRPEDYSLLMSGKVSINMLPLLNDLREQGLLNAPRYLPHVFVQEQGADYNVDDSIRGKHKKESMPTGKGVVE
jgi:hypothetical protein